MFGDVWYPVRDGDPRLMTLHKRHYSAINQLPGQPKCIGPGEHLALVTTCGQACWVWKNAFFRRDSQTGVNCSIFRNEGAGISSELILLAEPYAWQKWPNETRLFTFVAPAKIASVNPGYCFKVAGWQHCGYSEKGLHILEKHRT